MSWKPADGVDAAFSSRVSCIYTETAIVLHGRAEVPSRDTMRSIGFTNVGGDMYEELGTEWAQWGAIEIKGTVDLSVGRELRVDA